MSTRIDTNSYLEGLSALAARGFASIQAAVDAILELMIEQLGMRSSFLTYIKFEDNQLLVLAAQNRPGGCNIQVGTAVPISPGLAGMKPQNKRPSPLLLERLQPVTESVTAPAPQIASHISCYIGVPIVLSDGTFFGTLCAVDPEPQVVKPQQAEMLVILARRLANEIEHDYERAERIRAQNELAQAMVALGEANKQLQYMNKLKSDLVSIVGHEFRTALTGIQGFSEMMRDGEFSAEEMREFGGYINTDARRLSRMINDMLDLERMELGKMALRLDKVELNDVLKEVVEHVRSSTSLHTFRFQLDNALPSIIGDRDKLVQVVTNLVTNAIKYSPQGGDICICSTLEDDCVHVQVQDQGVGIPADYLEHVFERYCRIEAGSTRYIKGTGLGLPIVRQIVQMHGGKTWAESVQGSGSIFHVTLPLAVVPVEAK